MPVAGNSSRVGVPKWCFVTSWGIVGHWPAEKLQGDIAKDGKKLSWPSSYKWFFQAGKGPLTVLCAVVLTPPNLEIIYDDIIASHFQEPPAAFVLQGGIAHSRRLGSTVLGHHQLVACRAST